MMYTRIFKEFVVVEQKSSKTKLNIKKRILPSLLISFVIPFMLCFSAPFEIYGNNVDEFLFTASSFIWILILFVLLLTLIFFFAIFFLPNKAYRIASAVLIAFGIMLFLQGTYLNGNMSSLSGDNLGVAKISTAKKVVNLLIWIGVIVLAVVLAILKDKKGIFSTIAIVVSVIVVSTQIITPVTISLTNKKLFLSLDERLNLKYENSVHEILTNKNLTNISQSNNIFYFCIDRFDEEYAEDALEKYPEIYDELNGFTWFQDNISIYGHTYPAVSQMLTSNDLNIETLREDYLSGVYNDNETLSVLAENGYQINLHTQNYYAFVDASQFPEYVSNNEKAETYKVKNKFRLAVKMVEMSLFRCVPLVLKNIFGDVNSSTCNELVEEKDADGNEKFSIDLKYTYDFISDNGFKSVDDKVFNFLHLEGCHHVIYNENWKRTLGADVTVAVKSSFDIINEYIKAMKDAGVYDDATIVITGDHGSPDDDFEELSKPTLTALFVKPSGSTNEPLKISKAQTSHDNIWATMLKSENIISDDSYGKSVFEISETENQTRRYVWHTYSNTLDEYVYEISGNGKNFDNWKIVNHTHFNDRFIMD